MQRLHPWTPERGRRHDRGVARSLLESLFSLTPYLSRRAGPTAEAMQMARWLGGEVYFGPSGLKLYQSDLDFLARLQRRREKEDD